MAVKKTYTTGEIKTFKHGGRPSSITEDVVMKLVAAFQNGLDVTTACNIAKISRDAYYRKCNSDQVFRNRIGDATEYGTVLASNLIIKALREEKGNAKDHLDTAKWWLERKKPESFGNKNHTVKGSLNIDYVPASWFTAS